jgi:hypothetical protein
MSDGTVYARSSGNGRRVVYYLDEISRQWRHPWFVSGSYDAESEGWIIKINPGFVNGEAPLAPSGQRDEDGSIERLPLTDYPQIPLPNNIFERPASAPEFFKKLGVLDPPKVELNQGPGGQLSITVPTIEEEVEEKRTMLQCVVFMSQARASQKIDASIPGNFLLANIVEYTVIWDTAALNALGRRPRINLANELPASPKAGQNLLSDQDDNLDHLPVATLYFVSPPAKEGEEPPEAKEPGATWSLYVKHDLFWNVDYAAKNRPPINIPGFAIGAGLAAFVGRYTLAPAATLGAMMAASALLLADAFNRASNKGRFWTV